ncbi:MAG: hypothetical protein JAY88_15765 [Candidatus Thiodiazotropha lotti]|nr:hypothetical protein [Candidatus Thiodiazotropha lotti]MCG8004898.1 hypothetical protein [Candidatus Thiodiazotropha lotti]MCG8014352.1 hypothetical protein [Candidatus Thiodiazotropha lotti]MCG8020298.1 hypothetical protein [Candidatus Thiodiazotropha lotti]MCW4188525.1 hypothetical protein [Candidatus Thiodiazotropha lotti]
MSIELSVLQSFSRLNQGQFSAHSLSAGSACHQALLALIFYHPAAG